MIFAKQLIVDTRFVVKTFGKPSADQLDQVAISDFSIGRLVNDFEVTDESFPVFMTDVTQTVADLMDDTTLHQGLGKHGLDGFLETGQAVHAGDEDIFDPPILQV